MGLLRHGCLPSSLVVTAARVCVFGPLVLVAGCATNKPSYVYGSGAQQMAAAQARKVEMEDDGQPVQPPPARAMHPAEDDPSQPWSPNYGKGVVPSAPARAPNLNLPRQVEAAVPAPIPAAMPAAWPVTFRVATTSTGSLKQLSNAEADTIMARAINTHEMRRQ